MITMLSTVGAYVSGQTYNLAQTTEINYIQRGYARLATAAEDAVNDLPPARDNNFITVQEALGSLYFGVSAGGTNINAGTVAIGTYAFAAATAVTDSVAIGSDAGKSQVSCVGNVWIGRLSGEKAVTNGNNTAVGDSALRECLSAANVAVGYRTAEALTTGAGLTALGGGAALALTTGNHNVVIGYNAMPVSTAGHRNVVIGYNAASLMLTDDNIAIGRLSLFNATQPSGSPVGENVGVGSNTGFQLTDGYRNTFIGANAGNSASQKVDAINSMALGASSFTTAHNQVVLGNTSVTETVIRGYPLFTSLPASVTPATNGEMTIEKTSNTVLTFKLKGSDGTVRSGTIALA